MLSRLMVVIRVAKESRTRDNCELFTWTNNPNRTLMQNSSSKIFNIKTPLVTCKTTILLSIRFQIIQTSKTHLIANIQKITLNAVIMLYITFTCILSACPFPIVKYEFTYSIQPARCWLNCCMNTSANISICENGSYIIITIWKELSQ